MCIRLLFQVYQDSIQLQKFYVRLRDEMCDNGDLLRSPALLFNENRLQQELIRERKEKDALDHPNTQNSTTTTTNKSADLHDKKDAVCQELNFYQRTTDLFFSSQRKRAHIPKAKRII